MISTLAITIIIIYLFLIGWLIYGFDKVKDFKLQDLSVKTKFSVVIPFRNEVKNLPKLLTSISELNYPKSMFEIILVDDDSEDESVKTINDFLKNTDFNKPNQTRSIKVIKNERISKAPKKDAITSAIKVSKYNWIVTTDADCILPKYWLDTFDEYIQTTSVNCIVAPVAYLGKNSFFNHFQALDFLRGNFICLAFIPLALFNLLNTRIAITLFIIKFSIDFLLLFKTSRFFKQETLLLSYMLSSILYPFFNVGIALLSFFKSYRWKGRTTKK